jgi:hypothetical protein
MSFAEIRFVSIGLIAFSPGVSAASGSGAHGNSSKQSVRAAFHETRHEDEHFWEKKHRDRNALKEAIKKTFPSSLHGTRLGHDTFWMKAYGGIEKLVGESIDKFGCLGCHPGSLADGTLITDPFSYQPSCVDCHVDPQHPARDPVTDDICLKCHSRQATEQAFLASADEDLAHKDLQCVDCHTAREMHGDENVYSSLLAPGAMDAKCENCHAENSKKKHGHKSHRTNNLYHEIHQETVDCTACHVRSVLARNSCHLDSVLNQQQVFAFPPHQGFKMLVNQDGKVRAATYMTITGNSEDTFNVIAPYFAHAISKKGISCDDCHGNAAVAEYDKTDQIKVISWYDEKKALVGHEGVIPVPPDWKSALSYDYVVPQPDLDLSQPWMLLKGETDLSQMLFA